VKLNQPLVVRFDADRPLHCVAEDKLGRVVGAMKNRRPPTYFEKEALVDRLGERQKAIGKALHNVRVRHASADELDALNTALSVITAAVPPAKKVAKTEALAEQAVNRYAAAVEEPEVSSAEAYLASQKPEVRSQQPVEEPEVSIEQPAEEDFTPSW
jgi:hypothetical protein